MKSIVLFLSGLIIVAFFFGVAKGHSVAKVDHVVGKTTVIRIPGPVQHDTKIVHKGLPKSCKKLPHELAQLESIGSSSESYVSDAVEQFSGIDEAQAIKFPVKRLAAIEAGLTKDNEQLSVRDGAYATETEIVQSLMHSCMASS